MEGAVVLDCGSGSIKAGRASSFPSDNEPYVVSIEEPPPPHHPPSLLRMPH